MTEVAINGRWPLNLLDHRAGREDLRIGWEVERLASMHELLKPGMLVYDIGAEQGDMSALFVKWTGVGSVLIEPKDQAWPNIKATWEANDLPSPTASWVGFAADVDHRDGLTEGWPECADGPVGFEGFASLVESGNDLPCVKLDTLAKRIGRPPDAITMDVEGAEFRVLLGATVILSDDRPLVWVSVHPEFMAFDYHDTVEQLLERMDYLDYRSTLLGIDHEHHYLFEPLGD